MLCVFVEQGDKRVIETAHVTSRFPAAQLVGAIICSVCVCGKREKQRGSRQRLLG